jgi:putative tryptophan/tyrosine transport system substrate-binding protein
VKRREFIALVGGAMTAAPRAVRAQHGPSVGYLAPGSQTNASWLAAFHQGLSEAGYVEGQSVTIEYRWAMDQYDRLPALASDLVRRRVGIITAITLPSALAAKAATATIPVVFMSGVDPVRAGLVASLNRPGGNATGVSFFSTVLGPKKVQLLHELAPNAGVIALLVNPNNANAGVQITDMQEAASALGKQLYVARASDDHDLHAAFAALGQWGAGALIVGADTFLASRPDKFARLAARHAMPAIYENRLAVVAGGLMSYGVILADMFRQAGIYTGRILKGEKPADLPVMQPTKFELVINLKTAKALGLTVPPSLLARADEVIE